MLTFDCMTEHHSVEMYGDREGKNPINVHLIGRKICVVSLALVRNLTYRKASRGNFVGNWTGSMAGGDTVFAKREVPKCLFQ